MILPEGVEVYIKSTVTGEKYMEYEGPGCRQRMPNKLKRYIAATTDDTFAVVVNLDARFNYYDASGVRVTLSFDTSQYTEVDYLHEPKRQGDVFWEESSHRRKVNNRWKAFDLCFGEMAIGKWLWGQSDVWILTGAHRERHSSQQGGSQVDSVTVEPN